jgi:flagellar biosynthesis protein FliR
VFAWPSADWNLILLIAVRILAMIETAPLLSTESIPQVAKVALAGLTAFLVFPSVQASGYAIPADGGEYALLLVGEALIGVIMGFFLTILFSAFAMAGQFFSLQIGFSASETYDPLSEVEIPVMGQFLNLIAMFVFVSNDGFQKLFMIGVQGSFKAMRAVDLVSRREDIVMFLARAVGALFSQSLILSFPILGTLFILTIALGLLSKAAPQMNLLTEGTPINLLVTFGILFVALPLMMEAFARLINSGFNDLAILVGGAL